MDEHFRENELAYLALDGKREETFRDRLAFSLQQSLSSQYMVSTEFGGDFDIVISEKANDGSGGKTHKVVFELKSA